MLVVVQSPVQIVLHLMHPADVPVVSLLGIAMLPARHGIIPYTNWSVLMRVNTNHIGVCLMIRKRVIIVVV